MWSTSALISDGVLSVVVGLAGDYNVDGVVNTADYILWRNHEGTGFALPNRDPNLEGDIGQADYEYWVANFGNALDAGLQAVVPEPGAVVLVSVPGLIIGLRQRWLARRAVANGCARCN
jgi:hypothetical protein